EPIRRRVYDLRPALDVSISIRDKRSDAREKECIRSLAGHDERVLPFQTRIGKSERRWWRQRSASAATAGSRERRDDKCQKPGAALHRAPPCEFEAEGVVAPAPARARGIPVVLRTASTCVPICT